MIRPRSLVSSLATLVAAACLGCSTPNGAPIGSGGEPGPDETRDADAPVEAGRVPERGEMLYEDPQGRFEVRYPRALAVLGEPDELPRLNPPLAGRVRFQLRELLGTDVVDLEPPPLTVEIFAARPESLRAWLETHDRLEPRVRVEPAAVAGAREALWLRDPAQMAPNEYLWIAAGEAVYRLIPVGALGETTLRAFALRAGSGG